MTPTSELGRDPTQFASHRLLQALAEVQTAFIQGQPAPWLFQQALAVLLELTGSEHGFIGEVVRTPEGTPSLQPLALTSASCNLQRLFSDVLTRGEPMVSNPAEAPEREGESPAGAPPLRAFLGLPFRSSGELMGLVGLANRPGGYDEALICGALLMGLRSEQRRRRAEDELRQTQKRLLATDRLASLGRLTAGVAHEINNPLAYMLSNLSYVTEELHSLADKGERFTGERARDILAALDETLSGSNRVRDIVRDLKLFARSPTDQLAPLDLHALLDSCVNMVWGELKHRARLVKDYGQVPLLHGNESRLAQVFLNLLINASQALPPEGGEPSEVRIVTRHEEGVVMVSVRDTGMGIREEHLGRLFDPVFTTKPASEGTGLGLSICHGIVTSLGGHITVESQPGRGSTFRVFLPVAPLPAQASAQRSAS
jgi:signal transduction histidine kinase